MSGGGEQQVMAGNVRLDLSFCRRLLKMDHEISAGGAYSQSAFCELEVSAGLNEGRAYTKVFGFNRFTEKLQLLEAKKTRGGTETKLSLSSGAAHPHPANRFGPMADDLWIKVLLIKDVAGGDVISWKYRRERVQPHIKGHFEFSFSPTGLVAEDEIDISFKFDECSKVHVEQNGGVLTKETGRGSTIYRWAWSRAGTESSRDTCQLVVSSYLNYQELGHDYWQTARQSIVHLDAMRPILTAAVKGAQSRFEQATAVYNWIVENIKYVSRGIGDGSVRAQSPYTTMVNGYGDGKDHATIFASLLGMLDIKWELVLVNRDGAHAVSEISTFIYLNHVILYLPEFEIYADTTGALPLGSLRFSASGNFGLHVGSHGIRQRRVSTRI